MVTRSFRQPPGDTSAWTAFPPPKDRKSWRVCAPRIRDQSCWFANWFMHKGIVIDSMPGSCPDARFGIQKVPKGHICTRLFLASAREMRTSADAQVTPRLLAAQARGEQTAGSANQTRACKRGMEGADHLGMPAQGHREPQDADKEIPRCVA